MLRDLEKRFFYQVAGPLEAFVRRQAENVAISPMHSDIVGLAQQVCTAVYHFWEKESLAQGNGKVPPMADKTAEAHRQRLSDIVDTAKHGRLRDSTRVISITAGLAFETNDAGLFRFLRTEVQARNKRWGTFDVYDTLLDFIPRMVSELGVRANFQLVGRPPQDEFSEYADTYITPKSGIQNEAVEIIVYGRDDAGKLVRTDPKVVNLRVFEMGR